MTSASPIRRGWLGRLFLLFHRRRPGSSSISSFTLITLLSVILIFLFFIHMAINAVASRTRTVAGHNQEATPWHPFNLNDRHLDASTYRILRCSYFSCLRRSHVGKTFPSSPPPACPSFFHSIHRDLEPWRRSRISRTILAEGRKYAAMRVVILGGNRLFLDLYYSCVQSRAMFTVWGLLQLLRRYPGMVPDVDLVFDCMDHPMINRTEFDRRANGEPPPPPLFRYCTTKEHFDIPFPDWSFWGW